MAGAHGAMQAVEFHTGLEDPVGFAVRMLRKAYGQGVRVLVTAPTPTLEQISRQLWLVFEREFVAHVLVARCSVGQLERTPIWLGPQVTLAPGEPTVVINVGADPPADPSRLERLIEVVSSEADAAAAGRKRWRQYKLEGFQISHSMAGGLG
jgi:DNA polymerase-3 subunit chi